MPVTKAQQKATAKYRKENYDQLKIEVYKGKKAIIQGIAQTKGVSLNAYVNRAIDNQMERDIKESKAMEASAKDEKE